MFTAEQIIHWKNSTNKWLVENIEPTFDTIEDLRDVLRFHEYRYYVLNDPLISDVDYDMLFKRLEKFEQLHPASITRESPTQRVGAGLIKDFPKVQHLVPMLSLNNSYNTDDLKEWDRKTRELTGLNEVEYSVEPKFDGASISLLYEGDRLSRAATRGDGETGDDITPNVFRIRSIPLSASFSDFGYEQVEIRGEVLMNKNAFVAYNDKLMQEGLPPLANPRNAAAGTLRIKDSAEVSKRNLDAFLYHVSYTYPQHTHAEPTSHVGMLEMLWKLGFKSPIKETKVVRGIDEVIKYIEHYETIRDELNYEIDGMVVKVNDLQLQENLGMTSHHPRWAVAFKFKARQATSKLLAVEYQVGRTGAVTPVAKINPVQVGGVTVSSISIHNEDYIREKDLRIGDTILIERSGDVIPQIVKSMPEWRDGTETQIVFPELCPVCADELYKPEGEAVWRCVNMNCKAQVVERMIHFVSKDAMDIRSLGESNINRFFEHGIISDVPSIYTIDYNKVATLEGFGAKSIEKLKQAIEDSKLQPLHRLIFGLGIRYVGETTSKTLAQAINNIFDLSQFSLEQLKSLNDVGEKVGASVYEFFQNKDNIHMLDELKRHGLLMEKQALSSTTGELKDLSFLFTGTLSKLKRNEAEEMVEAKGGKILSGVSSKLNYLVVGADAGSKLEKARKIPGIRIISEDDFLQLIGRET